MNIKSIIISIGAIITFITGLNFSNYVITEDNENNTFSNVIVSEEKNINEKGEDKKSQSENIVVDEIIEINEEIKTIDAEKKQIKTNVKQKEKNNTQKKEEQQVIDNSIEPVHQDKIKETDPIINSKTQDRIEEEPKIEIKKQETEKPSCTETKHSIGVGNTNKWFNSKQEAISYYDGILKTWGDKWENFEIDSKTYDKNCPYRYDVWSCPICGKWTMSFYYR